mgnify:CR=1 FL=1
MCGIVGYIGSKEAYPVLIKGLHRLEYRGYDSSGVAMISDEGKLNIYKAKGKVAALEHFAESKDRSGTVGIAHTRWATHGEPNDTNAHPHASQSGDLAIVHNGTIENYTVVKKALEQHGYAFRSETDTEVVVQLIDYIRTDTGCMLFEAVREACHQIVGAYAIAVIDRRNPNQIVVARKSSPLVIGVGDGEYFIASDATPIVEYTNRVVYLNDDEIAVINRGESLHVFNMDNKESKVNIQKLRMSISELEKGGYPHFMLKEIFEQPRTLRDCIRGRVSADGKHVVLSGVLDNKERFLDAHRILIVACGTSWHAALIGKHLFEDMCRIPVEVEYASEFRYRNPVVSDKDVLIAMSQSGETADTLAALELAKEQGAFVFGICNVIGSSIPRATDSGCYIHVGPEIGVASTKAFTGQVTVLAMMALMLGRMKGTIADEAFERVTRDLHRLPELLQEVLLGLHSLCVGADAPFFNGHTNISDDRFLVFGVGDVLTAAKSLRNALLFNVLAYMSDRLLTAGNTVAALDELYLWLSNPVAIEYIRNCLKRVRKRDSALMMASQNLEDFDQEGVREMTKPLFAIPPHQFLFNPGSIGRRFYMDMLQLDEAEFELIRRARRGECLFKCGAERYHLKVIAPDHKAVLFGTAGGK